MERSCFAYTYCVAWLSLNQHRNSGTAVRNPTWPRSWTLVRPVLMKKYTRPLPAPRYLKSGPGLRWRFIYGNVSCKTKGFLSCSLRLIWDGTMIMMTRLQTELAISFSWWAVDITFEILVPRTSTVHEICFYYCVIGELIQQLLYLELYTAQISNNTSPGETLVQDSSFYSTDWKICLHLSSEHQLNKRKIYLRGVWKFWN